MLEASVNRAYTPIDTSIYTYNSIFYSYLCNLNCINCIDLLMFITIFNVYTLYGDLQGRVMQLNYHIICNNMLYTAVWGHRGHDIVTNLTEVPRYKRVSQCHVVYIRNILDFRTELLHYDVKLFRRLMSAIHILITI